MMTRRSVLFAVILTLEGVGLFFVSAWSERQPVRTLPIKKPTFVAETGGDSFEPAGTNQLFRTDGVTNAFFIASRFGLALANRSEPSGQVAKASTKTVSFFRLPDGTTFTGDARDRVPNGWGVVTQPNGTTLEGDWRYGNPDHLTGIAIFSDGTVEHGTWDYVRGNGNGAITRKDGLVYKGDWRNDPGLSDSPEGTGTMTWPDGHTYAGRFHNGKMHGQGKITYPDGRVVEGLWGQGQFLVARQAQ